MTYYGPDPNLQTDLNQAGAQAPLPTLQIAPNMPVQAQAPMIPRAAGGSSGKGGQLNSAAMGKRIAAMLNQKYGDTGYSPVDQLGTLGDEPLVNAILAQPDTGALSSVDSLGTLGDEPLINSMGL